MKRSSGERAATIAASPRGSGARSAAHARRGERERVVGQRDRRGRGQALELIGAQLAQAAEVRDAEVLADADERDALGGHAQLGEPGEDLGDLQLVVEVGLEPQHVLAVAAGRERARRAPRSSRDRLRAEEARPHGAQLRVADIGHRPLVQHVAPHDDALDERRLQQRLRRRVAVGHVQRPGADGAARAAAPRAAV